MKNLFNEDDFNSLFESSVIDSEGKGPKNNTKTPDVGATKGMQSDFDSMFDDLFSDAEMGDDQSAPVAKQPDTGAAGGSVDPEGEDKGKQGIEPPTKSEWDSLFETADTDTTDEDPAKSEEENKKDVPPSGDKIPCGKKCKKKGGKKLKSDFESLFEDDDVEDDDDETAEVEPGEDADVPPVEGEKKDDKKKDDAAAEVDSVADEFADLMSDLDDLELTGF